MFNKLLLYIVLDHVPLTGCKVIANFLNGKFLFKKIDFYESALVMVKAKCMTKIFLSYTFDFKPVLIYNNISIPSLTLFLFGLFLLKQLDTKPQNRPPY